MKPLLLTACLLGYSGGAGALELQRTGADEIRAAETAGETPVPEPVMARRNTSRAILNTAGINETDIFDQWETIGVVFFKAEKPASLEEILGDYEGYVYAPGDREFLVQKLILKIRRNADGSITAVFPMPPNDREEEAELAITAHGAEFRNVWGGRVRFIMRKSHGGLAVMTTFYSDDTRAFFKPVGKISAIRLNNGAGKPAAETGSSLLTPNCREPIVFIKPDGKDI
jgi:hypothetical protein